VRVGNEPARLEQTPPLTDYSEEEEEEIKEQLRQLGYMD
jgi:hypothetical protein